MFCKIYGPPADQRLVLALPRPKGPTVEILFAIAPGVYREHATVFADTVAGNVAMRVFFDSVTEARVEQLVAHDKAIQAEGGL